MASIVTEPSSEENHSFIPRSNVCEVSTTKKIENLKEEAFSKIAFQWINWCSASVKQAQAGRNYYKELVKATFTLEAKDKSFLDQNKVSPEHRVHLEVISVCRPHQLLSSPLVTKILRRIIAAFLFRNAHLVPDSEAIVLITCFIFAQLLYSRDSENDQSERELRTPVVSSPTITERVTSLIHEKSPKTILGGLENSSQRIKTLVKSPQTVIPSLFVRGTPTSRGGTGDASGSGTGSPTKLAKKGKASATPKQLPPVPPFSTSSLATVPGSASNQREPSENPVEEIPLTPPVGLTVPQSPVTEISVGTDGQKIVKPKPTPASAISKAKREHSPLLGNPSADAERRLEEKAEEMTFWALVGIYEDLVPNRRLDLVKSLEIQTASYGQSLQQLCKIVLSNVPLEDSFRDAMFHKHAILLTLLSPISVQRYLPTGSPRKENKRPRSASPIRASQKAVISSTTHGDITTTTIKFPELSTSLPYTPAKNNSNQKGEIDKLVIKPSKVKRTKVAVPGWGAARTISSNVQVVLYVLLNLFLFVYTFGHYMFDRPDVIGLMGWALPCARGLAATLRLNSALVLILMCKNVTTALATTALNDWIPFERHINWHKKIGRVIFITGLAHAVCHYFDLYYLSTQPATSINSVLGHGKPIFEVTPSYTQFLYQSLPGVTGHAMVVVLAALGVTSHAVIRRSRKFNIFWYSHHLYILYYGLLLVHGFAAYLEPPAFYYWFTIPCVLFIAQWIRRRFSAKYQLKVQDVTVNPFVPSAPVSRPLGTPEPKAKKSKRGDSTTSRRDKRPEGTTPDSNKESVLYLQIQKPSDFNYKAGQYLYLNCPQISGYEWHPFTITSAPSDPFISVHIRQAGDWTSAMVDTFSRYDKRNNPLYHTISRGVDGKKLLSPFSPAFRKVHVTAVDDPLGLPPPLETANSPHLQIPTAVLSPHLPQFPTTPQVHTLEKEIWNPGVPPLVAIDGPFGAPSQLYPYFRVCVFVGAGIGVTPFASILRYRLHIHKEEEAQRQSKKLDGEERLKSLEEEKKKLSHIEFMWIRRDEQGASGRASTFGWMQDILTNLELDPAARDFLRVHNFLTGGKPPTKATTTATAAPSAPNTPTSIFRPPQQPVAKPEDSLLNSRNRTHYGRPNWDEIFHELATCYPNDEIGLFICGPRPLTQFLKTACILQSAKAKKRGLKTRFVFHKENF